MGFHFTETEFQSCTGSKRFARLMAAAAPFNDYQQALLAAKDIWLNKVDVSGWLESFATHPEIGTNKLISQRCKDEQKAAFETATDSAMEELLEWNSRYKDKFGFIFLICASGRGMPEILDQLKKRFQNRPIVELEIAIGEEMKIIELRLASLFEDNRVEKLKDVSGVSSNQQHRPPITTHILDVSRGCPASGVEVHLEMWKDNSQCPLPINGDPSKWVLQGSSSTDNDGRSGPLMSAAEHINPGFYRVSFNTGKYAPSCFFPYVSIVFEVKEKQRSEHFHVPLLFSPFSFSTYRGS
ncbi:Hydroxyisourate hydrolase [Zostera marina]|uniref:Hydroxyisourate hydrolase n=1 Tax=Zostera marina TaxID=29655 RepID=A0A0K9PEG9_ZOSMR|nr:Hydroxyisourate hydrolase [Zostera marina]